MILCFNRSLIVLSILCRWALIINHKINNVRNFLLQYLFFRKFILSFACFWRIDKVADISFPVVLSPKDVLCAGFCILRLYLLWCQTYFYFSSKYIPCFGLASNESCFKELELSTRSREACCLYIYIYLYTHIHIHIYTHIY